MSMADDGSVVVQRAMKILGVLIDRRPGPVR